jgi:hypothetical protein
MGTNTDSLQSSLESRRERVVDNEEATKQGLPRTRGLDWTSMLAKTGLESPGYHETIAKMKTEGRIKG